MALAGSAYLKGREEYRKGDWIAARKDLSAAQDGGYKPGLFDPKPSEMLAKMDAKEKADAAKAEAAVAAPPAAPAVDNSTKPPDSTASAAPTPPPVAAAPAPTPVTPAPAPAVAVAQTPPPAPASTDAAPTTAPATPSIPPTEAAAPVPAPPPVDTKAQAHAAYLKGREEYRKGDWIAARQDLMQAQSLNYKNGLFEDSPAKYLARMDAKENVDAAKAAKEAEAKADADAKAQTQATAAAPTTAPSEVPASQPSTPPVAVTVPPTTPAVTPASPAPATTPYTGTTTETVTPTPAAPSVLEQLEATAKVEQILKEKHVYEARQLVEKADQAKREGRNVEALNDYGQAVLLDPTNDAARQGRQQMMEIQGLAEGNPSHLTEQVRHDLDIRRDRVNQLVTQYLDTANADIQKGDFVDASRQIDLARTAVATDNTIFTRDELVGFTSRIDAVDRSRAAQQASSDANANLVARTKAEQAIHEQEVRVREEQEHTIHDLITQTQQLIHDAKYEQAMGTLDHILSLDPRNDYARGVKPLVQEKAILQEQRGYRELFDLQLERSLNAAEEKRIPYDDILKYPPNWPDISEIRDAARDQFQRQCFRRCGRFPA
jgi:tetratricopeptide (TPR) repeat protein